LFGKTHNVRTSHEGFTEGKKILLPGVDNISWLLSSGTFILFFLFFAHVNEISFIVEKQNKNKENKTNEKKLI